MRLLLAWISFSAGPSDDPEIRYHDIKPAIDTIHLIHSTLQDARLQKWYSTLPSDFDNAMSALSTVWKKYPPADREYMLEARNLGFEVAERMGMGTLNQIFDSL